jgi:hypothetical protein
MKEQLKQVWQKLDPKLKYTVLTAVVTYALAAAAIQLDPTSSAILSTALASFVGYKVENAGTLLRSLPQTFVDKDSGGLTAQALQLVSQLGDDVAPVGEPDASLVEPDPHLMPLPPPPRRKAKRSR